MNVYYILGVISVSDWPFEGEYSDEINAELDEFYAQSDGNCVDRGISRDYLLSLFFLSFVLPD